MSDFFPQMWYNCSTRIIENGAAMLVTSRAVNHQRKGEFRMATSDSTSNSCYVYVMQAQSGEIKIGLSLDIEVRRATLESKAGQKLNLIYTLKVADLETAHAIESALHQRYQESHLNGDWFKVDASEMMKDIRLAVALARVIKGVKIDYDAIPAASLQPATNDVYATAVDLVERMQKASISMFQRHMNMGFNRAARLFEQMENDGIFLRMGLNKHASGLYK